MRSQIIYFKEKDNLHFLFIEKEKQTHLEEQTYFLSYVTGEVGSYNNYEVTVFNTEQEMLVFEEEISNKTQFKPISNSVLIEIDLKNIINFHPKLELLNSQLISSINFVCKTSGMAVLSRESLKSNFSKDNIFGLKIDLVYHQNLGELLYENLISLGIKSNSEIKIQIE
jgi:hypothetical protein